MNEIWKDIPSCTGYEASNTGKIRRKSYELSPCNMAGYRMVMPGGRKNKSPVGVHRLVMEAFHGQSELVVNHKDGDKSNNNLDNLEYTTQYENLRHARSVLGKRFGFMNGHNHNKRACPIIAFKDGVEYERFNSGLEASFSLKIAQSNISAQLNGRISSTGGFTFKKCI